VPIATAPRAERAWLGLLLLAAVALVVGTFLPWLRSGAVWRNSYEVWQSADRLGVVEGRAAETLHVVWFLLPLGAAGLLVTVALDRPRPSAALALVMGALAVLGAAVALTAPLPTGTGPLVTLVGGGLLVAASLGTAVSLHRRPRPT
jgi:hypothetical protein